MWEKIGLLFGTEGKRLMDGFACCACCKVAGYGTGIFSSIGLAVTSKADFIDKYNSVPVSRKQSNILKNVFTKIKNKFRDDYSKMTTEQLQEEMKKI